MNESLFQPFYLSKGICTDTRNIQKDSLFICIKGDNFDGNTFAEQALENGASHVIVDNKDYFTNSTQMTLVENSVHYLQSLAKFHRSKFDIPVIGITGSNGKTSTKELMNAVLSKKYKVLATIGNLNNHLGVPLTLLRMNEQHEIAIIEMGANRFKDIEELCEIASPNYGLITNIGKAHLEGFGNFEGVLRTKRELYESVFQSNGTVFINADDEILTSALPIGIRAIAYGSTSKVSVQGELCGLNPFVELKWRHENYASEKLTTKLIGKYNYYNFLAAVCVGIEFKVDPQLISEAIVEYNPTNKRSQVVSTLRNTLILDCYNANPTSMASALDSFAMNTSEKEKVVVLGEMKELGTESDLEHRQIITQIEKLSLDAYTVGTNFDAMKSNRVISHFKSVHDFISSGIPQTLSNKLILLKGSRSVQLEKLESEL